VRLKRIAWSAVTAALVAAAPLGGQAGPPALDSLRARTTAAAQRVTALAEQRERAAAWADEQYRAIAEARRRDPKALRPALRQAQTAADSLARLDRRLDEAVRAADAARQALAAGLQAELERTVAAAERARPPDKATLTARARALSDELQRTRRPVDLPPTDVPAVVVRPTDGPAEIELKADFLADRATQLRSAADVLAGEITRERRRAELQDEVERLVAQTRLFDETDVPPPSVELGAQGTERRPVDTPVPLAPDRGARAPPPAAAGAAPGGTPGGRPEPTDPVSAGDPRTASDRLTRLRADLLRQAAALERQSGEIRRLLRDQP